MTTAVATTIKRIIDMLVSGVCLIVFSPLILIVALVLKFTDHEPVFYLQERIGYHGKPFMIIKFRTMKTNAEADGVPMLYSDDDDRVTGIGRWLRDHHLDELPQLWNVFVGDMAFVGPRPERKFFIEQIMAHNPAYSKLYSVRPGITSNATLYNGYTDTMEKMLRRLDMDLDYLEHQSLLLDAKILLKTFLSIVVGKRF